METIHQKLSINGIRLHVVTAGLATGDPVVLLHGWPQTWREWRHVMARLAGQYRLIVPDLRGLGDSERPATGYDTATLADDLAGILAHLKIDSAHLVGHDLGGPVVTALALKQRKLPRSLTIIECQLPGVGEPPPVIPGTGEPVWHFAFHANRDLPEALITGRERLYVEWFFRHFAYNPDAFSAAEVDEYARAYAAPGALRAGFEQYRAWPASAAFFTEAVKTKLTVPVLALGGSACLGDAALEQARRIADRVEGGTIEACGHWVPEERPDELVERLRRFWSAG